MRPVLFIYIKTVVYIIINNFIFFGGFIYLYQVGKFTAVCYIFIQMINTGN